VAAPSPCSTEARGYAGESGYDASAIEVLEGLEPVRRRPGMYIGGTDEKALHHLFAEVIDNSMDEAVAGHATFIEVELEEGGWLSVTDNGRGIPVDPHPKFPKKSALEVIMTTLHAGGKFDSKVYETSGGLHGVGVSVVNALSEILEVEVARGQTLYRQVFARGAPKGQARNHRPRAQPARHQGALQARPPDLRQGRPFPAPPPVQDGPLQGYLFGGVEIRWKCAPALVQASTTFRRKPPSSSPTA
jgi:topoisomerase-4 subunit B